MEIRLEYVSASEAGDYFQVLFEAEEDGDGAYVLLQRQFEDPDGGVCYIESSDLNYIGHFRVMRASLARSRFCLELGRKHAAEMAVTFETTDQNYRDLMRVLLIMIPHLEVADTQDAC